MLYICIRTLINQDENKLRSDGMLFLSHFNIITLKAVWIFEGLNIWEAIYMITVNVGRILSTDICSYSNLNIKREVESIIGNRFVVN